MTNVCVDCEQSFEDDDVWAIRCARCAFWHQASILAAGRAVEHDEPAPRKWSRAWNRARLGVNGDTDD